MKFQYLMVQLKGCFLNLVSCENLFQYLMVQLKDNTGFDEGKFYYISIPHGTIKSFKKERRILPDY